MGMSYWYRRVFLLALPLIFSNLTQPLLSTVDTVLSGHLPGPAALGGVAVGGIFFNSVFWTFGFLRMATTGLVAQSQGAGDEDQVMHHFGRALLTALLIGALVLVGIVVSILATLLGGDPKLLLIRESFITGALGMVCLTSLVWSRPLMFYIGRQFSAGEDPAKIAEFNALWQYPVARHTFRVMTIVWAIGWIGEFALRVAMVWTLSIPEVLVISPFVFNGITIGLIAWTLAYGRRQRQRGAEARARGAAAS